MDGILGWIVGISVPFFFGLGLLSALDAIMKARTAQGATAWVLALLTVPFISVPAYWLLGRSKFAAYDAALREFNSKIDEQIDDLRKTPLGDLMVEPEEAEDERTRGELLAFQRLATQPFTRGNHVRLLIDGEDKFDALLDGLDRAEKYILIQYYTIRDDEIGTQVQERLVAAAERGVRIYLLYDEVGSHQLSSGYLKTLRAAGVEASGCISGRSWLGRFRLNFRNHRKIVVVDGRLAYVGGLNVGDEYLGRNPKLSPWRDTHATVEGPAILGLQYSFLRDWYYGSEEILDLDWTAQPHAADQRALILASGPADETETCGLLYTHAIESAEKRAWIASPYFVPDGRVLGALQLAAMRGVDVRVLMPRESDSIFFKYVPYTYLPEITRAGVKVFLYEKGFMHQKVMLVDDDYAAVGTANFDNRSFRLNFEVTCLVNDQAFCQKMAAMLEEDFSHASEVTEQDLEDQSFAFRLAARSARLFAPVL